jgi:MoaA/NifB/PqqE/SkfB family radical SAM enzyme
MNLEELKNYPDIQTNKIYKTDEIFANKKILFAVTDQSKILSKHADLYQAMYDLTYARTSRLRANLKSDANVIKYFDNFDLAMAHARDNKFDYVFLQSVGNLVRKNVLLEHMNSYVLSNPDFFMLAFTLDWESEVGTNWVECHHQMAFINVSTWKKLNCPNYGRWETVAEELPNYTRSAENFHDKYTPHWMEGTTGTSLKTRTKQGWGYIKAALAAGMRIDNFTTEMRDCRWYIYPEADSNLLFEAIQTKDRSKLTNPNQRRWISSLVIPPQIWIYNSERYSYMFPLYNTTIYFGPAAGFKYLELLTFNDSVKFIFYDYNQESLDWLKKLHAEWDGNDYPAYLEAQPDDTKSLYKYIHSGIEENQGILFREFGGEDTFKELWARFKSSNVQFVSCNLFELDQVKSLLHRADRDEVFFYYSNIFATDVTTTIYNLDNVKIIYQDFISLIYKYFPEAKTFGTDPLGVWQLKETSQASNNNLTFVDNNLDFSYMSVETAHSLGHTRWKGWHCSAGIRSLYIDFDGNVFRGTCLEGGWIGNVNVVTGLQEAKIDLQNNKWIVCGKEVCACGSDMTAPKVKQEEHIVKFFPSLVGRKHIKLNEEIALKNNDTQIVYAKDYYAVKLIIWDLGRRCNFDCWYCSPNSHNNYEAQKNLAQFTAAYNVLKEDWIKGESVKFSFTGGEPTIYKDYLPFIKMINLDGNFITTTTNGSLTYEYYAELVKYSSVTFSIHLEYVKKFGLDKFINAVRGAVDSVSYAVKTETAGQHSWVGVRIMFDPGNQEIADETYQAFKTAFPKISVSVQGVHITEDKAVMYKYEPGEITWLENLK